MNRILQPEILDFLPADDPRALRSRGDLRRVNAWMRSHVLMARAIKNHWRGPLSQIIELGAGDGHFLLRVAQKIHSPHVQATLLDMKKNVTEATLARFQKINWRAQAAVADVFDWLPAENARSEIIIANLFLHHFEDARLADLLQKISTRTTLFIALEPRRARWPLLGSRLLWTIGCNGITRHDAAASVRAGFSGGELSALWPHKTNWRLTERRAGWFSHLFVAQKIS
jgi:hypothetical protein